MTLTSSVSKSSSVWQFIQVLLIFVFVLLITYFTTKFVGSYQKGMAQNNSIQILEAMKIGNNKYIQIVKVLDEYYVIAVAKDNVAMLGTLSEEEAQKIKEKKAGNSKQFSETLSEVMDKFKDKLPKK